MKVRSASNLKTIGLIGACWLLSSLLLASPALAVRPEPPGKPTGGTRGAPLPSVSIGDAQASEADGVIEFPVTLSSTSRKAVQLTIETTSNGTGEARGADDCNLAVEPGGSGYVDFLSTAQTVTVPAGALSASFPVQLCDDIVSEWSQSLRAIASSAVNAELLRSDAYGKILDDDSDPVVSIDDVSILEGTYDPSLTNPYSRLLHFTVSLSKPSEKEIRISYRHSDVTADSYDYRVYGDSGGASYLTDGVVFFDPMHPRESKPFQIRVSHDSFVESDETFEIHLLQGENAQITDGLGIGTILNDD